MKRFAKLLVVTLGFGLLGFVMSLFPQRTAKGTVASQVDVVNTPLPVTGAVSINGVPTVQVNNSPSRGPDDEPEPTALLTREETNPAFEPFIENLCLSCGFVDSSYTVPSRTPDSNLVTRLVVEDMSGSCGTFNGQTISILLKVNGTFTGLTVPLIHEADFTSNTASLEVFGRTTRMYLSPGSTINLLPSATANGTGTVCNATLEGYFVVAPIPVIP